VTAFLAYTQPVEVVTDDSVLPLSFLWARQRHHIEEIVAQWRVDGEWWREESVSRDFFKLTTDTGLLLVLCYDRRTNKWYVYRWFN